MSKNIKSQLFHAIDSNFKEGTSKHEYRENFKAEGHSGPMDKVFSYAERDNLKDTANQFSKYIKENYGEIKYVKDIPSDAVQKFLDSKQDACSQKTLDRYACDLRKISAVSDSRYNCATKWDVEAPQSMKGADKIRNVSMSPEDFTKIVQTGEKSGVDSKSLDAVKLVGEYGMRVNEVCKLKVTDIDLEKGTLSYRGKGGRGNTIDIRDSSQLQKCIDKAKAEGSQYVCRGIKPNSVNKYLARTEEKCGLREKYKDANTSVHAIRKMVAQREYDSYRKQGFEKRTCLQMVSKYLNHGEKRYKLMKVYVENMW